MSAWTRRFQWVLPGTVHSRLQGATHVHNPINQTAREPGSRRNTIPIKKSVLWRNPNSAGLTTRHWRTAMNSTRCGSKDVCFRHGGSVGSCRASAASETVDIGHSRIALEGRCRPKKNDVPLPQQQERERRDATEWCKPPTHK